jgi:CRP/FNR family transcriptional regulator, nitrogen fixation regulation protein
MLLRDRGQAMQIQALTASIRPKNHPYVQPVSYAIQRKNQRIKGKLTGTLDMLGAAMSFSRNDEIYGEDETANCIYKVVSGAVRSYKLFDDGRRQINAFYLPGDVFGLEAARNRHFSAEAVTRATILVVKRSALVALAVRQNDVANDLWTLTARELEKVQNRMIMLGHKNAQERVAAFLLEMAGRASDKHAVELPMSRQDIADYLGLTIETVSRTFTQLENEAAIELPSSRRVVLRDRGALNRLNAGTPRK